LVNFSFDYDNVTGQQAAPEPSTLTLLGIGLAATDMVARSRRNWLGVSGTGAATDSPFASAG
jgi:hypothetical protein